jgi:uncharacterized membrane protein YidH (DUF202 family)
MPFASTSAGAIRGFPDRRQGFPDAASGAFRRACRAAQASAGGASMAETPAPKPVVRPTRVTFDPLPPIPSPDPPEGEHASTEYSHYRTGLSRHRTGLSEHRTDLSEFRTDLSMHRTDLSEHRSALSTNRTEMSSRRTGMSIQRTRMSADRTLMSVIRTALSLIGFGFTVHEAFKKALQAGAIDTAESARNFGLTLIVLGILLLVGGIVRHLQFALELRRRRAEMIGDRYIHGESRYPVSMTLITAVLLLLVGLLAVASVVFNVSFLG